MTQDLGKQEIILHVGVVGGVGREIRSAAVKGTASSIIPIRPGLFASAARPHVLCSMGECFLKTGQSLVSLPASEKTTGRDFHLGQQSCPTAPAAGHGPEEPGAHDRAPVPLAQL